MPRSAARPMMLVPNTPANIAGKSVTRSILIAASSYFLHILPIIA